MWIWPFDINPYSAETQAMATVKVVDNVSLLALPPAL
jgi:hypothetical protein